MTEQVRREKCGAVHPGVYGEQGVKCTLAEGHQLRHLCWVRNGDRNRQELVTWKSKK